jgi:hypothetical protein
VAKIGNPANGLGCSKRRGVAVHFKYSRKKQLKT